MDTPYRFDEYVVLRSSRYPLTIIPDTEVLVRDPAFMEALYLASPVLYKECVKYREGGAASKKDATKLANSLGKYFIRMSSRCTPFGLFSGCAVVGWGEGESAVVTSSQVLKRHTRPDMFYLCALAEYLSAQPSIRQRLVYFANSSTYRIGEDLRYVECFQLDGHSAHQLSSVLYSDYLQTILEATVDGLPYSELAGLLMKQAIPEEAAKLFIDELIRAQLLVSEMEPTVTGEEFLGRLTGILKRLGPAAMADDPAGEALAVLCRVQEILQQLDEGGKEDMAAYQDVMAALGRLPVAYDESLLFQTDMGKTVLEGTISAALQPRLGEAVEVLSRLGEYRPNPHLQEFIRRYVDRYEDKEMPLLEVLDAELSIGYAEDNYSTVTPLIEDIFFPDSHADPHFSWGALERLLSGKLEEMYRTGRRHIELKEEDLPAHAADWQHLPPSFHVQFRIVQDEGETVYLEHAGSSSGVNLLGRFAHSDAAIAAMVERIAAQEQAMDPGVIFAEIVHLPERRAGNILLRPVFRAYEIPYLAHSATDGEHRIALSDLYISVKGNAIVLRSRRLNKVIIPRLGTAHNYVHNALPVYRFLCDLQLQGKRGDISFQWGALGLQHRFLPRVRYKDVILHLASWRFQRTDLLPLTGLDDQQLPAAVTAFRERWELPERVVLSDGDNDLLVDFRAPSMVRIWLDAVKNKDSFQLREFISDQHRIVDEGGRGYVNQLIAVLCKTSPSYGHMQPPRRREAKHGEGDDRYAHGEEWVYYKLYCGVKSADKILQQMVQPLSKELMTAGLCDKWFFIRYKDPDFHLRLRFHIGDGKALAPALEAVKGRLREMERKGYLWKVQQDTYKPEIERYGRHAIGLAEFLFCHDSMAFLDLLEQTSGDDRENVRWLWGLRSMNQLLDCFQVPLSDKHLLMTQLRDSFWAELNVGKPSKQQVDEKYRVHKKLIGTVLDPAADEGSSFRSLWEGLEQNKTKLSAVAAAIYRLRESEQLEVPLSGLLASYLHMMVNRLSLTDPRKQEAVLYDFLARHYKSLLARSQQASA
ncbi:MAG TPA: lantibiotic dehydratase [Puia sp.]